jgi:hypothetical protein
VVTRGKRHNAAVLARLVAGGLARPVPVVSADVSDLLEYGLRTPRLGAAAAAEVVWLAGLVVAQHALLEARGNYHRPLLAATLHYGASDQSFGSAIYPGARDRLTLSGTLRASAPAASRLNVGAPDRFGGVDARHAG